MTKETSEDKEKKKRIQTMIDDLLSRNERKIIGVLKRVPHEGSPEIMEAMFTLYHRNPSKEITMLLEKSLHNLKDPKVVDPMVDMLADEAHRDIQTQILSAIWLSGLDVGEHLELLVKLAIEGEYMTAIESLTIIEHQEFSDDVALTNSIKLMDKAVEVKGEKQDLMVTLRQVLLDKLLGEH